MQLLIFVTLLIAALLGTGVAVRTAATTSRASAVQFATVLSGATGLVWLLVTISAFNVVAVSGGSEFSYSYPSLGVVGVVGVAISVVVLIKGSLQMAGNQR